MVDRLEFQTGRPDAAEDIAQQAFIELASQLERGADIDDLRARLNAIAEKRLFNHWRTDSRRAEDLAGLAVDMEALAGVQALTFDAAEFREDFDAAVRALPEPERGAFILTDLRGLTVREAADVLHTTKSTVARQRLAAHTYIRKELSA